MALGPQFAGGAPSSWRRRHPVAVAAAIAALLAAALAVVALLLLTHFSEPSLSPDATALARVKVPLLGGTLERAEAFAPDGQRIALTVHDGRLTPLTKVRPGELIAVDVVIRRPSWLQWALGSSRDEQLTVRTPLAHVEHPWLTLATGAPLRVVFDQPVSALAAGPPGHLLTRPLHGRRRRSLNLGAQAPSGTIEIAAAARPWELLGPPQSITWFPRSSAALVLASPAPSAALSPTAPIDLTFSKPVAQVLGSALPRLSPATSGSWRETDTHTLVFHPSGTGFPLASNVRIELPKPIALTEPSAPNPQPTSTISWSVAPGSTLRLEQLLAQQGYLPVAWTPTGAPTAHTALAQTQAAIEPPAGTFTWRYPNTPAELQALWHPGRPNTITRGAVMSFEHNHQLAVDGIAGPVVWRTLLAAAIAGQQSGAPYSYVYVHEEVPESLTLWSAGRVVLRSPGNTGIPEDPTKPGTFTVFEHIPVGTMSGTNPDGTHYHDPGIRYISYFNGGDAIHEYPRASYGTPQSLGCVELPLADAAKVWPYTPIGTLVTIEK
jgi:hypothetical protein